MPKLEVFFDYICPYCLKGHNHLMELLPKFPGLEVEWYPCESHPRPEQSRMHSDLCAQGMYFASEQGADLAEYHHRMYNAALTERADVEDVDVLAEASDGLLNPDALREALSGNRYADKVLENNRLAWGAYGFPAVPSFRLDGITLESIPDVGVSKKQLEALLEQAAQHTKFKE